MPADICVGNPTVEPTVVVGEPIAPMPIVDVDEPMGGDGCKPIVGNVGVPSIGAVDVPMIGSVGVPIVGASGVPIVVVAGVPMVGFVGVPIAGSVGVPRVGIVVPIVGSVEAPVPNVGARASMPGVSDVCVESVGELMPEDADVGGPKFVRLDGSNKTDCA